MCWAVRAENFTPIFSVMQKIRLCEHGLSASQGWANAVKSCYITVSFVKKISKMTLHNLSIKWDMRCLLWALFCFIPSLFCFLSNQTWCTNKSWPDNDGNMHWFDSLASWRCGCGFRRENFKDNFDIHILRIQINITLEILPEVRTDGKSTLVQVTVCCHQATSHYLNQSWSRSPIPCGVTGPLWVYRPWSYLPVFYFEKLCLVYVFGSLQILVYLYFWWKIKCVWNFF